jgi:predicted dehydrogenase
MKALIIGLGSMGKRRIRNIQHLNEHEKLAVDIVGFDIDPARRAEAEREYGIITVATFEDGLAQHPGTLIICTPPHLHQPYIEAAVKHSMHFFTELSILSDGLQGIVDKLKSAKLVAAPSFTMRHHESLQRIKAFLNQRKPGDKVTFFYHSGRFLPDWHPWEDYRTSFLAREGTSGCRELISFELTWLPWVFGAVKSVFAHKAKVSTLALSADVYDITLEFENGNCGQMKIDVVTADPQKWLRVVGEKGNIEWDRKLESVRFYNAAQKTWEEYKESPGIRARKPDGTFYSNKEDMYIAELRDFFAAVRGEKPYPFTLQDDLERLRILDKIEESAANGAKVMV